MSGGKRLLISVAIGLWPAYLATAFVAGGLLLVAHPILFGIVAVSGISAIQIYVAYGERR